MSDDDRPYQAQNAENFADQAFLAAVAEHAPSATTSEISEAVGCSQQTASRRLGQLADQGKLERKQAGPAYVWSLADEK